MCGIAGIVNKDGAPVDRELLTRMNESIRHRGPDDDGFYFSDGVGLAMRRLAIIDLAHGQQPIHNQDRTAWIVFNGEIYNYRELREQLEKLGHKLYTSSDTEAIVHAYNQWGTDCPKYLRGMFAFAIWDESTKSLTKPFIITCHSFAFLLRSPLTGRLENWNRAIRCSGEMAKLRLSDIGN